MKKVLFVSAAVIFLASCAPLKMAVVKMQPVTNEEGSFADPESLSVSSVKDSVKVTARFVGFEELKKLTEGAWQNPYASQSKTMYTVFELTVENSGEDKVAVDPFKCVILDGLGNQYAALTDRYFKDLYPAVTGAQFKKSLGADEYQSYYYYTDEYYKRGTADKTIFKPMDIYPKVKQKGYAVFEAVGREAAGVTLILPGVVYFKDNVELKKLDFKFKFEQKVTIEQVIQ